jgi:hypothetical protein
MGGFTAKITSAKHSNAVRVKKAIKKLLDFANDMSGGEI